MRHGIDAWGGSRRGWVGAVTLDVKLGLAPIPSWLYRRSIKTGLIFAEAYVRFIQLPSERDGERVLAHHERMKELEPAQD